MDEIWKRVLWNQFGATIDMLGSALKNCPDELWGEAMWNDTAVGTKFSQFWYVGYHVLFWLDLYLTGSVDGFVPPAPFDLNELDPRGLLPARQFRKDELISYLAHCRQKCDETLGSLTDEKLHQSCRLDWFRGNLTFAELLLDNMRHVQEHAAQLSMFLGQNAGHPAHWLAQPSTDPCA